MKILLIYPPLTHMIATEIPESVNRSRGHLPPLGLLYVASYLKKYSDHDISVLDSQVEQLDYDGIGRTIRDRMPDIVGVQASTFSLIDALKTLEAAKSASKKIITVIGGVHPSIYPAQTLDFPDVDFVVMGEAEKTFTELAGRIERRETGPEIPGIGYKKDGRVIVNPGCPIIGDLDGLPFPDRTLTPYKKYYSVLSKRYPITTMITSRGCPYGCIFCNEAGSRYRAASADTVLKEIDACLKLGIKEIFIHDDTFTVNRQRVMKICEGIIKNRMRFEWDARGRVDTVDEELLLTMKRAGCVRISYGVESGSQKVLDNLNKGIKIDQVHRAFRHTKEAGITTLADFMIGSPGEDKEEILASIDLMKKIKADFVHFSVTTPYPSTNLYRQCMEKGLIAGDPWDRFSRAPDEKFIPPAWEEKFTRQELVSWVNRAYREHYLNPVFILKSIFGIRSVREAIDKAFALFGLMRLRSKIERR